jgi:hypothetical protein
MLPKKIALAGTADRAPKGGIGLKMPDAASLAAAAEPTAGIGVT